MFGLSRVERELFSRFPISHVTADQSNWKAALEKFPVLKTAVRIAQMPIREVVIDIYRVPGAAAEPTDFEKGAIFMASGYIDSAYVCFDRFCRVHPNHYSGRTHLAYAALLSGRLERATEIVAALLAERPDDYVLHGFCRTFYARLYDLTKDDRYRSASQYHGRREKELKQ